MKGERGKMKWVLEKVEGESSFPLICTRPEKAFSYSNINCSAPDFGMWQSRALFPKW